MWQVIERRCFLPYTMASSRILTISRTHVPLSKFIKSYMSGEYT
jgi:hypothetical protein